MLRKIFLLLQFFLALTLSPASHAASPFIIVASTTSTQNSGLFDHILPLFKADSGIDVRVVAVGTGAALRIGRKGDADMLIVHHRPSEDAFIGEGFGSARFDLMYNDFLLVGPETDPAGVSGNTDIAAALQTIGTGKQAFVSRGDDSGTHKKELSLWQQAGIDVAAASGSWYRETGSGMGATLNTAAAMNAYALTDRGTWLSFRNRQALQVMSEGDERLRNPYGILLVNPEKFPWVRADKARQFADWLMSEKGQHAIAEYRINGEPLFRIYGQN